MGKLNVRKKLRVASNVTFIPLHYSKARLYGFEKALLISVFSEIMVYGGVM